MEGLGGLEPPYFFSYGVVFQTYPFPSHFYDPYQNLASLPPPPNPPLPLSNLLRGSCIHVFVINTDHGYGNDNAKKQ